MNTLVVMEIFHLFFIRSIWTSLYLKAVRGIKVVCAALFAIIDTEKQLRLRLRQLRAG